MKDFSSNDPIRFRELGRKLSGFLDAEGRTLSKEEEAEVSPILHSLDEMRYHFTGEEFLGEGGEKILSKTYDTQSDRYVVAARPRRHGTDLEKEEFLREARLTCKLQHPNILPIHEIGIDKDGIPYFIMRLFEGEELGSIARKRIEGDTGYLTRYPLEEMLEIFLKVCDTVIYAHSRNVLHLDIKPANIMVGRYGQTILYDWGMAAVVSDDTRKDVTETFDADMLNTLLHTGTLKGTPGYMAPEQIAEDGVESYATDIYALGAVLYHILTGTIPVQGSHAQEVMLNTREGKVVRPRLRRPQLGIPGSLGAVTMKALQREPENRYRSVQELHDEVTRYLRGFAPRAERANPVKRLQLLMRRHSKLATAILLSGMVIMGVIGTFYSREKTQSRRLEVARAEAVRNLDRFMEEKQHSEKLHHDLREFTAETGNVGTLRTHRLLSSILDEELKKEELDAEYRKKLIRMKMMQEIARQNFIAVRKLVEAYPEWWQWMELYDQIAVRFGEMKPDDDAYLSDAEFALFLEHRFSRTRYKEMKSLAFDLHMVNTEPSEPEKYLRVAIAMLNIINDTPGWQACETGAP
jgi:serine/threonine-protein kinase